MVPWTCWISAKLPPPIPIPPSVSAEEKAIFLRLFRTPLRSPASKPSLTGLLAATLFSLFGLVSPALGGATCTNTEASSAVSWTRWECTLDVQGMGSALAGHNPYRMKLKVTYRATGQQTRIGYAFWDGWVPGTTLHRFRMRMHFPPAASATTWTWSTSCETPRFCSADTSKTNPSLVSRGTVSVSAYSGPNPLYQGGPIRFLQKTAKSIPEPYQGNQRFIWIGDSAWVGPLRATTAEWDVYLENRRSATHPTGAASANATILQIGTAPAWASFTDSAGRKVDKNGNPPFDQLSGCTSSAIVPNACSVPNFAFWRAFEEKLDKANQQGLYIFLAGLMEPQNRYPATKDAVRFARWLVSRLSGNFVLFSPGFDSPPSGTSATGLIKAVGAAIKATSPAHPVTNHWSTSVNDLNLTYTQMASIHREPWFDFALYQSGHLNGDERKIAGRAREMAQVVAGYTQHATFGALRKATVNGEAVYDDGGTATSRPAFRAYRARHAGYVSWLAGSFGYTHGTGGIWDWGACSGPTPNACGFQMPLQFQNFRFAMASDRQSFKNVKFMGEALRWTASVPLLFSEQTRIKNPGSDEVKKRVVARSSKFLLVYLPHNADVQLDYGNMNQDTAKLWNPATGATSVTDIPATGCLADSTVCTFPNPDYAATNPDISDRLIVLTPRASNTWSLTDPNQLEVIAARFAEGQPIGLFGRQLDPTGKGVSPYFEIHNVAGQEPRDPAVGRDGRGRFLVAWSMDVDGDSLQEVWGKWILPAGSERLPVFRISPADGSEHFEPAVAISGEGVAFVSWTRARWPLHNREIWSRSVTGDSLGEPKALCASAQADCSASKVAASLAGAVTVAWVESELATGLERIVLQSFEKVDLRRPLAPAQQVNTSSGPNFWLHHLHIDAAGVVVAEYEGIDGGASAGLYTQTFDAAGQRQGEESLR